ncbi:hypothetical protein AV940_02825 [Alteromonas sp. Mac2]|nr:hypothetical protein AV940_02825 [Alteromonas sp. Mac2]
MGHNGEAAPRVCVQANEVSELIELLCITSSVVNIWCWRQSTKAQTTKRLIQTILQKKTRKETQLRKQN